MTIADSLVNMAATVLWTELQLAIKEDDIDVRLGRAGVKTSEYIRGLARQMLEDATRRTRAEIRVLELTATPVIEACHLEGAKVIPVLPEEPAVRPEDWRGAE